MRATRQANRRKVTMLMMAKHLRVASSLTNRHVDILTTTANGNQWGQVVDGTSHTRIGRSRLFRDKARHSETSRETGGWWASSTEVAARSWLDLAQRVAASLGSSRASSVEISRGVHVMVGVPDSQPMTAASGHCCLCVFYPRVYSIWQERKAGICPRAQLSVRT